MATSTAGPARPVPVLRVIAECGRSRARAGELRLPHGNVPCPVFMPVGTRGTAKGLTAAQLAALGCRICLGNTFHLGTRPGSELVRRSGGLHGFMDWPHNLLTDSGGFQMVSLLELSEVSEEGVRFQPPHGGEEILLSPEKSMEIQNALGADIVMQLDDVVSSTTKGPRVEEAMHRSVRWLDRCLAAHARPEQQLLFAIVQGGLDLELRLRCIQAMTQRDVPGFAIGGLSGGEDKAQFWRTVKFSAEHLPRDKPRYLMGVGYATDLVVCVALGCDMFDCVFPTRTARFGSALVPWGSLQLKNHQFAKDFRPIDADCGCPTCQRYSRAYLHALLRSNTAALHLLTLHNIAYQMKLMGSIRESILQQRFPEFVREFMDTMSPMKVSPTCRLLLLPAVALLALLALQSQHPALPPSTTTVPPSPPPRPGNTTPVPRPPRHPRHPLQPPYPYPYRFLLNHPDKCRQRAPFLVLLVVTSPADLAARDAVRRTWGNESAVPGLSVLRLFLLGLHPVFSAELSPVLQEEDKLHGDLLQQDFLDTYNNLTLKTLMGLEWVSRFCPNATYVIKADHDVFLNLEFLARLLRPVRTDFLTGYVYRHTGPLRHRAYKWFVPREVYPNNTYPPYCGGPAYVLSGDLALRVFAVAQVLPVINMEDAFVGICLHALGVDVTDSPPGTFNMYRLDYDKCRFSRLVMVHHYWPQDLLQVWPHFRNESIKCP